MRLYVIVSVLLAMFDLAFFFSSSLTPMLGSALIDFFILYVLRFFFSFRFLAIFLCSIYMIPHAVVVYCR